MSGSQSGVPRPPVNLLQIANIQAPAQSYRSETVERGPSTVSINLPGNSEASSLYLGNSCNTERVGEGE